MCDEAMKAYCEGGNPGKVAICYTLGNLNWYRLFYQFNDLSKRQQQLLQDDDDEPVFHCNRTARAEWKWFRTFQIYEVMLDRTMPTFVVYVSVCIQALRFVSWLKEGHCGDFSRWRDATFFLVRITGIDNEIR